MTGVGATLTIQPTVTIDDAPVRAMLGRLAGFGDGPLFPALDAIGEAMVSATQMRFHDQHGPGGVPWPPSKAALREKRKTLIKTARLVSSITHNLLRGAESGVEWGTNVVYAAMMQMGGTITHYARSQQIYRRTNKAKTEILPGFVKRAKSNFASWITIGEHTFTIRGWPFIGIDKEDIAEMDDTLTRALKRQAEGGAA